MDKLFRVEVISRTEKPQTTIYAALHQDYSEGFVFDDLSTFPSESKCGEIAVNRCTKFGHWGVTEHPQITFNVGYFPHSVMQQARTHRIASFDVQSGRYSGKRICDLADKLDANDSRFVELVERVFYLRPVGHYTDRKGAKYEYTEKDRFSDISYAAEAAIRYRDKIVQGYAEEHARGLIPFDIRQHFVVSFNARSLMHFFDLRAKADAQLEIVQLCELMWPHFAEWMPELAAWYYDKRWKKARLAP